MNYTKIVKRLLGSVILVFYILFLSFAITAVAPITEAKEPSIQVTSIEYLTSQPTIKKASTSKSQKVQKSKKEKAEKSLKKQKTKKSSKIQKTKKHESKTKAVKWTGPILTRQLGTVEGPSGKETYYNLPMQGVIRLMKELGYENEYWVRDDGVKMYGKYIMCAASLNLRPKGTIIETSLGTAMVCDTGSFAEDNPQQIDIAVAW